MFEIKSGLDKIEILSGDSKFLEEPWKVFLGLETKRFRYASLYDPELPRKREFDVTIFWATTGGLPLQKVLDSLWCRGCLPLYFLK